MFMKMGISLKLNKVCCEKSVFEYIFTVHMYYEYETISTLP